MTDPLAIARLGVEAESFKSSGLGRYLNEMAEAEIIEASRALCIVLPADTKAITELQNKVYRAESFITWIEEAIEAGNFVIEEIRNEQE